ncbi:permease-like cell division protein FtsX [Candidatus Rariloculus sp.]|uniref:permease-like cell division protein FtsX n=1 Tax=Candidatus Rariloculus sp. TaxID=3101265 RepID=UPI003D1348C2
MIDATKRYFGLHVRNLCGAIVRLVRQPAGSLLTVLVIATALALPAGLRVLVGNVDALSGTWEGAPDFTVYLHDTVTEQRARELASEIDARGDVATVAFISRADALEEFRAQSGFGEALDALEENPLPHTLVVRPGPSTIGEMEALAESLGSLEETSLVQLDTQWVARLRGILVLVERVVDIVSGLVALAVILVIGNTIRLEVNNRSTEIEVMKLVGGSDGFIRRPFLYLGFCYGLAGSLVAVLLVGVALALMQAPVRALAELYASAHTLTGLGWRDTFVLLGGGAALGWAGAWLATARHLRAIEPT